METLLQSRNLTQRAFWLIHLRWVAIAGLAGAVFFSHRFFGVKLPVNKLYILSGVLLVYNFVLFELVRYVTRERKSPNAQTIGRIISFQMAADLVILTTIIHYSGGIENPFFLFFVFHMILASIMLSAVQSYIVATFAIFIFSSLVWLEYSQIIPHYSLEGFVNQSLHKEGLYVFGKLFVLGTTLYLVVYITTSISRQLRKQQNSCEKVNIELRQQDKVKNEYVIQVTHDIKGHLAAINSCLEVILEGLVGPVPEKQRDFIERAQKRTAKCMEFVRAILRLTHMKLSGRMEMENFSMRNIVSNASTAVERRAEAKSIEIINNIDLSEDKFFGEPVLIEEAITNILFNSVKYTPPNGKIHLNITDEGEKIKIEICDNGIGIPQGQEEKIFEEFYRAPNARETERDGTGLGLSITRQVVQGHGGSVSAKNNPQGGSTFTIYLPKKTPGQ